MGQHLIAPRRRRRSLTICIDSAAPAADRVCQTPHAARQTWLFFMAVFHGDFSDDPGKPALHGSVLRFAPPYY
jgi:hypothetical protein